ncbi:hypothetical protein [Burkholderia ambifaria]|uniref:hypothetical protein n=2 Tax=Burkholderia ambifaria TaxID=152480 RepID=UPI00158C8F17|nr:hypothetical protein [Burkholderia ambifaria]
MVNMNPLHGGAIVRAARLGRRTRAPLSPTTCARPEGHARCCTAPRHATVIVRLGDFHDKRSNLPVTYAASPFRTPPLYDRRVTVGFTLLQLRPYNRN